MSDEAELDRLRAMLKAYEALGWPYAANEARMALLAAERRAEALPQSG